MYETVASFKLKLAMIIVISSVLNIFELSTRDKN